MAGDPPADDPVVSERRPTAAVVAARRSGIAGAAVVVASVVAVGIIVALRFGGAASSEAGDSVSTATLTPSTGGDTPRPPVTTPSPAPPRTSEVVAARTAEVPAARSAEAPAKSAEPSAKSGGTPEAPAKSGGTPPAAPHPVEPARTVVERAPAPPPPDVPPPPPKPVAEGAEFDRNAARTAVAMAAGAASGCRQPDDPGGGTKVSITFAPSGRVTSARVVGPPFQGTKTGGCIAAAFRGVTIPPFSGDPVVVNKEVVVR